MGSVTENNNTRRVLFIDRDGTLIKEAPPTYQIDSFEKLEFFPEVFRYMRLISELGYELVMVTNQDGLGTGTFTEESFWPVHRHVIKSFMNEGICFGAVHIDRSFAADSHPNRKPGTGMLTTYLNDKKYDIKNSYVIGDRITDVVLAKNLGCKAIWLNLDPSLGAEEMAKYHAPDGGWSSVVALETSSWEKIYEYLKIGNRVVQHERNTNETRILIKMDLDGTGRTLIKTGLNFFDHMLDQLGRHAHIDLSITVEGDLHIDEHHTMEDTAIALGDAFAICLGNKAGIERYGFVLPMDDCLAQVALDFGGRSWFTWDVKFGRERIGDVPTEMFYHFFKSFSDAARCNINIKAEGENEHHKIESIFKAFARAIRMAIKRDPECMQLPTTKGML